MIPDRSRLTLLTLGFAAALCTPALADHPFDGTWQVTVVTSSGTSCPQTSSVPIRVVDGQIEAPGGSGRVGREGAVRGSLGPATVSGHLDGNSGSGRWSAAAGLVCSGRWTALRQS